jgi:hypothetical protein
MNIGGWGRHTQIKSAYNRAREERVWIQPKKVWIKKFPIYIWIILFSTCYWLLKYILFYSKVNSMLKIRWFMLRFFTLPFLYNFGRYQFFNGIKTLRLVPAFGTIWHSVKTISKMIFLGMFFLTNSGPF